jgi:hypothetical protein
MLRLGLVVGVFQSTSSKDELTFVVNVGDETYRNLSW